MIEPDPGPHSLWPFGLSIGRRFMLYPTATTGRIFPKSSSNGCRVFWAGSPPWGQRSVLVARSRHQCKDTCRKLSILSLVVTSTCDSSVIEDLPDLLSVGIKSHPLANCRQVLRYRIGPSAPGYSIAPKAAPRANGRQFVSPAEQRL